MKLPTLLMEVVSQGNEELLRSMGANITLA